MMGFGIYGTGNWYTGKDDGWWAVGSAGSAGSDLVWAVSLVGE